jgi:hypothetical protein
VHRVPLLLSEAMGPGPINVEEVFAEYSSGNTDSVPGGGNNLRDTEVFSSPSGQDDATAASSSYADHQLTPAAMATPGGAFFTTVLDTVDPRVTGTPGPGEEGYADEVVYPPASRDEGPPGTRTGPPEEPRTTATHGPPANPVLFGKQHGGGCRCTPTDCYCGHCRDTPGHNPRERNWCFMDHLGHTHWCIKDTYVRAKQRYFANENGRPRMRPGRGQSAAATGTPGTAAGAAADRAPTSAAPGSHLPAKARPTSKARAKSRHQGGHGQGNAWYTTAPPASGRGISHPIYSSCGLLGLLLQIAMYRNESYTYTT